MTRVERVMMAANSLLSWVVAMEGIASGKFSKYKPKGKDNVPLPWLWSCGTVCANTLLQFLRENGYHHNNSAGKE